LINSND